MKKSTAKKRKTRLTDTELIASAITFDKLQIAIDTLKDLAGDLPDVNDETPEFAFTTDGQKAEVLMFSASLRFTKTASFWDEVDQIGSDNGDFYRPKAMEFWITAFRKAADKLERDLKECRSKPDQWKPLDHYR